LIIAVKELDALFRETGAAYCYQSKLRSYPA
jgi:hypothetical protein